LWILLILLAVIAIWLWAARREKQNRKNRKGFEAFLAPESSKGKGGGAECLVTKGDNNATNHSPDPWNVTQNDYIGGAVPLVPYLGYVSPAFWGFGGASALLPVSAVVIGLILVDVMRQKPREREEE
jgi:cytochrome c-type biogenesis protein CcmH/NrfF